MFRFCFLILLTSAHGESSTAVKSTVSAVTEGLNQLLDDKDTTRKIAVRNMIRTVSSIEAIDQTTNDTLENVTTLLNQVKNSMITQVATNTQYVNDHVDYMNNCDDLLTTEVANAVTATTDSELAHRNCRADHRVAFDALTVARDALIEFQTNTATGTTISGKALAEACATPAPIQGEVANWETHHADSDTWFTNARALFNPIAAADQVAVTNERNNRSKCDGLQTRHETATCGMIATYIEACSTRQTCWQGVHGVNASSDPVITQFDVDNTNIPKLVRLIDYVICLVEEMRHDRADVAQTNCGGILGRSVAVDSAEYANTHVYIPGDWPQPNACHNTFDTQKAVFYPFSTHYTNTITDYAELVNVILNCPADALTAGQVTWFNTYANGVGSPNPVPTLPNGPTVPR